MLPTHRKLIIPTLLVLLSLTACSAKGGAALSYRAKDISQLPNSNFTIAVVPLEDRVSGTPQRGTYFSDLAAYGLVLDLQKSEAGRVVHFSPEMLSEYDLVVDGIIRSPSKITYRIRSPHSSFKTVVRTYDAGENSKPKDQLSSFRLFTKAAQKNNRQFLKESSTEITSLVNNVSNPVKERLLRYYYSLDPEFKKIIQARAQLRSTGRSNTPYYRRVLKEIKRRQKMLDVYREAEAKIVEKKQAVRLSAQEQRIKKVLTLGAYERKLEEHEESIEGMNSNRQMGKFAGAVISGILPTLKAVSSVATGGGLGTWHSEHTLQAIRDTSTAFNAAPEVEAVKKPDYKPYYANLDKKAYQLKSSKIDPFTTTGSGSIKEMRKRFLRQYRQKIFPLEELR